MLKWQETINIFFNSVRHSALGMCVSHFIVFPCLLSKWRKNIRVCIESMEYANAYMRWCVFVHISLPWRWLVSCQSILHFGRLFHFPKKPNENCSKILIPLDFLYSLRLSSSFSVKWNHFFTRMVDGCECARWFSYMAWNVSFLFCLFYFSFYPMPDFAVFPFCLFIFEVEESFFFVTYSNLT